MSDNSSPTAMPTHWEPIPANQRRVLGTLIEKQKTSKSADAYPMTLNSITTGCNQKSNRDPVTDYDEDEIEETLAELQRRGLVMKMTGSRADRWRHQLYDKWTGVTKVEMAILAELLLRGAQTEGDLRARASRMDEIRDLDELRTLLGGLTNRGLVVYLSEPGRRGTMVTHGFHTSEELERLKSSAAAGAFPEPEPASRPASSPNLQARLDEAFAEIARLSAAVARLEDELAQLRRD